jgi:hypothetical protein
MVRASEYKANGEATTCIDGRHFGVDKPVYCHTCQWQAPTPTKDELAAVDEYRQKREAFEDLFNQAKHICLLEP